MNDKIKPLLARIKAEVPDYYEEVAMTYAEALKKEGIQEGKQAAQKEMAQQLLKSGIDSKIIENVTHLTKLQIEELKKSSS